MPETSSIQNRARSNAAVDPQDGFFDRVIEDATLAQLLNSREVARVAHSDAKATFEDAADKVKAKLAEYDLQPGDVVRCGRYRISVTRIDGGEVAFTKNASNRTSIKLIED